MPDSAGESQKRHRSKFRPHSLEAMRDDPEAGVVQWAKTTRCDKSAVSMRLGRLAKRGLVEGDDNGRWRLAVANPTIPPSL